MPATADQILAALPQTQCTRCGYPDCAGYAQAIAVRAAPINQCPPGGAQGIARLARLTGRPVLPMNPDFGTELPRAVAVIDENWCIGCTLCIKACPTDAILGSNTLMHTVIESCCTGCELCLPVCPVDCIELVNVSGSATGWEAWSPALAATARQRYAWHQERRELDRQQDSPKLEHKARTKLDDPARHAQPTEPGVLDKKRAVIDAALARARAKRRPGDGSA